MADLRLSGRVELHGEEVVMEIFEGEEGRPRDLGEVRVPAKQAYLLDDPLGVGDGGTDLALRLHQEPPQLVGAHVRPALRVPRERSLHVLRRLGLAPSEFPREKEAAPVAPHLPLLSVSLSLAGFSNTALFRSSFDYIKNIEGF